jgi:hypothetical protein
MSAAGTDGRRTACLRREPNRKTVTHTPVRAQLPKPPNVDHESEGDIAIDIG